MDNKLSELKEQLVAALAIWQQTNGKKLTLGWLHAANPEVISALLAELEQANKRAEVESVGADKCAANCVQWMKRAEAAEAFRDQMVKYVRTLGSSVISPSVVETILNAAEQSKAHK